MLVDAVALSASDVVHRDGGRLFAVCCGDDDVTDVVGWRSAVGVVEDLEVPKCQIERHVCCPSVCPFGVLEPIGASGFPLAQVGHT